MIGLEAEDVEKIKAAVEHGQSEWVDPRILEKDILVTRAIALVNENRASVEGIDPVFCGGTCLLKAYGIIERMSEDVDFKMLVDPALSLSQVRKRCRNFKYSLIDILEKAGFADIGCKTFFQNSYFALNIPYESAYRALHPFLKIECIMRPLYIPTAIREVTSLADRLLGIRENVFSVKCQGIEEILVEKTLGLLRRIFDDKRHRHPELMRHVYDISRLVKAGVRFSPRLADLFYAKIETEIRCYKARSQKFAENPQGNLLESLENLKNDPAYRDDYDTAIFPVLFDKEDADYDSCLAVCASMAEKLVSQAFGAKKKLAPKL